jgi:hypothetical protein
MRFVERARSPGLARRDGKNNTAAHGIGARTPATARAAPGKCLIFSRFL